MFSGILLVVASIAAPQAEPLAVVHVAPSQWADPDPDTCRARIRAVIENVAGDGGREVVWDVRDAGEALWPSELEPWSKRLGGRDPGFDPLAFALSLARAKRLAFHAGVDARSPGSVGFPERSVHLCAVVRELATRYALDGVDIAHLDDVGPVRQGDEIGTPRFTGRGNPTRLEWGVWRQAQIDRLTDDLAVAIHAIRADCAIAIDGEARGADGTGDVAGTVHDGRGAPLPDAWVTLVVDGKRREASTRTADADGGFAFAAVGPGPLSVAVDYPGADPVSAETSVVTGQVATIDVAVTGAASARELPFLEVLRAPERTSAAVAHVLGRTTPDCHVRVADHDVEVFATGLFAADDLPLAPGTNRFAIVAVDAAGRRQTATIRIERVEPTPSEPRTAFAIEAPGGRLELRDGELLRLRVVGPAGRSGTATFGDRLLPLVETEPGVYEGATRVSAADGTRVPLRFSFHGPDAGADTAIAADPVLVRPSTAVRLAAVRAPSAGITFGLHDVRLGGPWLTHVPKGTQLEVIGREGRALHVRLTPTRTGWVAARDVEMLPDGTPPPHVFFTSCSVGGDGEVDRITIPLGAPIPFAVHAEAAPENRIVIDLFGAHHAVTWISHRTGARVLGDLAVTQVEDEHVRLTVPVRSKQIWGYWTERDAGSLSVFVRRPPAWPDRTSVWSGLRIALEPGHGGRNIGARGLFGTQEKTINAAAVEVLRDELVARGAEVVVVRHDDEDVGLDERAERAAAAGAHFLVSVHANSAGTSRGYLRVSGTSTYYHEPPCRRAAELVYRAMLGLGWNEFGCVGNFSYLPIRRSRVPAILVEQAFVSNPADEARLLDPAYRRAQAVAIADGLAAFFEEVR